DHLPADPVPVPRAPRHRRRARHHRDRAQLVPSPVAAMASDSVKIRVDIGRIAMVPAAAIVLLLDLMALAGRGGGSALRWAGTLLTVAFYVLVIWCYLRRGPARATTRSVTARAAAVVATWIPFALPLLHGAPPGA